MKKIIIIVLISILLLQLISCSSQGKLINGIPDRGTSVAIFQKNGKISEGLFIKDEQSHIIYIDRESHKAEKIESTNITKIERSFSIYDFEANKITNTDIGNEKGSSRLLGYGLGGFALGTAVGFGIGAVLASSGVPLLYPMLAGALTGTYFFGAMGHKSDKDEAIKNIRNKRFAKSKGKLQKELDETRKLIEEKKKEKEKIIKEMESKKKDKKK